MENEFVTYALALRMKALGYNEPCLGWFGVDNELNISGNYKNSTHTLQYIVSAPTWQSAFIWFRENYNLHSRVNHQNGFYWCEIESYNIPCVKTWNISSDLINEYKSYKEAEINCLELLLEITESKSK